MGSEDTKNLVTTGATAVASAYGMPWLGPIAGSLLGGLFSGGDRDSGNEAFNRAMQAIQSIQLPDIEKMKLMQELYSNQGTFSPELEQALQLGQSKMEGISLDPRFREEQMKALEQMSQIATQGATPEDAAIMEMARRKAAGEAEAKSQQILMQNQARGMGGSGANLIAQLQAGQSGADRQQEAALQEAARSAQARREATERLGNMSGQMRGQEYGEKADVAKQLDAREMALANMNAAVAGRNVGSRNQAQQMNLQNAQNIANQNVNLRNQQQQYNKQLEQQRFNNEMQKGQAMAGMFGQQAGRYDKRASDTAAGWGQIGQGAGEAWYNYDKDQRMQPWYDAQTNYYNKKSGI